MADLLVRAPQEVKKAVIRLPASKSESNRACIIQALARAQKNPVEITIQNLSSARDTEILQNMLKQNPPVWDVQDAGTTMRFLTALAAATNQPKVLRGTARMHERPIGVLVEALNQIGFQINYAAQKGYPPLQVQPIDAQQWSKLSGFVKLNAQVSSQFISALLMIAPLLPQGLTIELEGALQSAAYVEMTIAQMQQAGIQVEKIKSHQLSVASQRYRPHHFVIEADWSAASYWFSMVALCPFPMQVVLEGLQWPSLQGDAVIQQLMQPWGVESKHTPEGLLIKNEAKEVDTELFFDFSNCPDLAQTVLVCVAASKANATVVGLESLRIKETDRIAALQTELAKFNVALLELDVHHWRLVGENFAPPQQATTISTYHDHRMAMAFAPLSFFCNLVIENKSVVAKSYPHFWEDLQVIGFQIEELITDG